MTAVLVVAIVVGLPVVGGLALAAYKTWLKHRGQILALADVERLKTEVARLRAENQDLRRRLENIETIIVSEVWEKKQPGLISSSQSPVEMPPTLE